MELPFTAFELTFLVIAVTVFSLLGLAAVCRRPDTGNAGMACQRPPPAALTQPSEDGRR